MFIRVLFSCGASYILLTYNPNGKDGGANSPEKDMKRAIIFAVILAVMMLTVPAAMCGNRAAGNTAATGKTETESKTGRTENNDSAKSDEKIRVWFPDKKETVETDLRSYLICVTAGEMPAAYEQEALCAQALAAATLVRRLIKEGNEIEGSDGAVVAADASTNQAYMSEDEMKKRWGDDYEKWHSRIVNAVDTVIDYEIVYDGEPILAAFHAISSGTTENAENVWGKSLPYLTEVDSAGDKLAPNYASSVTVSETELKKALGIESEKTGTELVKDARYTSSGTLTDVEIGGKSFTGAELRKAFSLRSGNIKFEFEDGSVTLSVVGYGHGIGMSQYGADYYARQGYTWREIIAHYYPGTEIKKISE